MSVRRHHLRVEGINARIKHEREAWRIRWWMVIRYAPVDPQPATVIAVHAGLAPQTVRNLPWVYQQWGPTGISVRMRHRPY